MELFSGRPLDVSDRSEKEVRVYDYLDDLSISYSRLDHAPAFGSEAELCDEIERSLGAKICKNLFLFHFSKRSLSLKIPP